MQGLDFLANIFQEVWLYVVLSVVGFVVLIKFAEFFVDGAASLARNFKISTAVVGLTIVAFGTSAPELAISFNAHLAGNTDMMLGNVIGSNITNLLVILGLALLINPFKVERSVVKKDMPILVLITLGLSVLLLDNLLDFSKQNVLSRNDGIMLLLLFFVFVYYLITLLANKENENGIQVEPKYKVLKSIVMTVLGLVGIIIGSTLVVDNVSEFARSIGISQKIIAVTVVSIGTSLPELVTTVIAAKKGENDIAIGNIVGSNIFNTCIVLGLPIALLGDVVTTAFNLIDIMFMVFAAMMVWVFSLTGSFKRYQAVFLLLTYVAYIAYIVMQ